MLPGVIPAVDRHYATMRELETLAVLLVRRFWNRVDPAHIAVSWLDQITRVMDGFTRIQLLAAEEGAAYTAATLEAQGIRADPDVELVPSALVGWASDGRLLESLLEAPAAVALDKVDQGVPPAQAVDAGRVSVERIARTQIADTGRAAAGLDVATRPKVGWVRMVNPPVCSRCLVLAGRFYRWSDGFQRHPNCDCVHVATNLAAARREGLVDDPTAYFKGLSRSEQDRLLGKAGAEAVRDGADMNQVVNARRGMTVVGSWVEYRADGSVVTHRGRTVSPRGLSTEGITGRGFAGRRLQGRRRLMPEQIYREATSRDEALRLLKVHGYII